MSLPKNADASAINGSLWPPRDKQARRLWHELQKFKKQQLGGAKNHTLDMPPQSSYMRACTHHFAQLLGLSSESRQQAGDVRAVRVLYDAATAGSSLGPEDAAAAGSKRKDPPTSVADDADGCSSTTTQSAAAATAGSSNGKATPMDAAASSSSAAEDAALAKAAREAKEAHQQAVAKRKREFTSRIAKCVKHNDTATATAVWRELVASGITPTTDLCSTLLHIYTSAPVPLLSEALEVFEAARQQATPLEPMWSGLIKLHCACGDTAAGLRRVEEMLAAGIGPRLRSFSPIIAAACEALDHATAARAVDSIMANAEKYALALSPTEHLDLLRLATHAAPADGSRVEAALRRMMEDGPQLGTAHVEHLQATFEGARTLPWAAVPCTTDERGVCSYSGLTLGPTALLDHERAELSRTIPQLIGARVKATEFGKFTAWLEEEMARHGPYAYVLDGANIGFFGHSKQEAAFRKAKAEARAEAKAASQLSKAAAAAGGGGKGGGGKGGGGKGGGSEAKEEGGGDPYSKSTFSYRQVDWLLDEVRRTEPAARVLLVLHVNHVTPSGLNEEAASLVGRWRDEGVLCVSPQGMNDDWYWLHAAVASGPGCRVVSNDEMRDHTFGLMSSPAFAKWKERHVVHFDIPSGGPHAVSGARPTLMPPLPYSHVMQEHASGRWHLPCAEQHPDGWVCLHRKE